MELISLSGDVKLYSLKDLDVAKQEMLLLAIQNWFPHRTILRSYLTKRLTTYSYVLLSKKHTLSGIFFMDMFDVERELFLYVGPSFAKNFFAYLDGFMYLFKHYFGQYHTIHLLAEVQNPLIMMQWHLLFPEDTTRSIFNYKKLTCAQWKKIELYEQQIKHFMGFHRGCFKTTSDESLFNPTKQNQILVNYLIKKQIFLEAGDSAVLYTAFRKQDIPLMMEKVPSWLKEKKRLKEYFIRTFLECS